MRINFPLIAAAFCVLASGTVHVQGSEPERTPLRDPSQGRRPLTDWREGLSRLRRPFPCPEDPAVPSHSPGSGNSLPHELERTVRRLEKDAEGELARGNPGGAVKLSTAVLHRFSGRARAYSIRGRSLLRMGAYGCAVRDLERACDLDYSAENQAALREAYSGKALTGY